MGVVHTAPTAKQAFQAMARLIMRNPMSEEEQLAHYWLKERLGSEPWARSGR
jgi:hypothetical protein